MSISETLSHFIVETGPDRMPGEALGAAKRCIIDCLGVLLAGTAQPESRMTAQLIRDFAARPQAGVAGQAFRTSAPLAAFANGVAAHALDYDDISTTFLAHPSANLAPPLLALGESEGASGEETLAAYVVGYEAGAHLGAVMGMEFFARSWHATSILGVVASAAASARLLHLDAEQTARALAISASLAAGLKVNFGSMTKPLHVGNAAQNGVLAALMAQRGMTANVRAFDGPHGFCAAYTGAECDLGRIEKTLGNEWLLLNPGVKFKLYPSCGSIHGCIEAVLELKKRHRISAEEVQEVECVLSPLMVETGASIDMPQTGQEGRFSLPYNIALGIIDGRVAMAQFTDERVRAADAREIMSRVRISCPEWMGQGMEEPQEVSVLLKNGLKYTARVENRKGTVEDPISDEELFSKFRSCASVVLNAHLVEELFSLLYGIERLPDIRRLAELVTYLS